MSDRHADSCRQIVELVTEYLDGGLEVSERLAFERHVAICPPCRGYLSQLRRVSRVAGSLSEDDVPERLRKSLHEAFRELKLGSSGP
ncbi:MAG: zf-HC2 domain-containing protein [Actinobacteria bacterium]|nr:zf-HC2 domain-containing protein [Actinomycetota bacterium]